MEADEIKSEIARNFDALQRKLGDYLPAHAGQFALLKDGQVIEFFTSPGEADREGGKRFSDLIYSIQQITSEPIELGLYANAIG